MSSLFNKTTGISLSSVLGSNNHANSNANTNSNGPVFNSSKSVKNNNSKNNNLNSVNGTGTSIQTSSSMLQAGLNIPTKQFSEKLKLQQHQYALNANNYLKTIDNCLEEASRTGDLLLNGKSLIEFPSSIALRYDLTDTLNVDLSKNRLSELPKEILRYKPLEKLSLNLNIIRTIPEIGVNQLRCIKTIDLNSNRLTFLPASICGLTSLEILTVNNNKLVSLPEEIGRLDKLIQLDVSCNEITHLPTQIGDMNALRALNVRRNLLVELPKEISQLKLVNFDCSSNRINKLPLCFREMVTLIDLVVDNNPLELPPAHICTKGLLHIMKYLLVEAIKEEKKRGVLSEYEINTQLNQLSTNGSNSNGNKRESCNSSTGLGSIGSLIFQSSVKNMNKKYSDNLSTQSTTASSSASTVSTSSSVSTSSLSAQNLPSSNKLSSKGRNHNSGTSSSDQCEDSSVRSKSLSSTLMASTSASLKNNDHYQFLSEQSTSVINKHNLFITNENNDFIDAPSMSSTSSPSSTTSSSPTTPVTGQSIVTTSNKVVSIHDLISSKSTLNPNSNNPASKFQNPQQKFVNYNQSNKFVLDGEDSQSQQIWCTNEVNNIQPDRQNIQYHENPYELNISNQSPNNFNNMKPSISALIDTSSKRDSTDHYEIYNTTNSNLYRNSSQSLKTPDKPAIPSMSHQLNSTPKNSYIETQNDRQIMNDTDQNTNNNNQIIYDEFLNPILISDHSSSPETIDSHDSYINDMQNNKYYQYEQQQQQMIWVPRDDIVLSEPPVVQSSTVYNPNQHKPQYAPKLPQQTLTLPNGRELPADLRNVDPAFTIRRHFIQTQEDNKQIETLRKIIEAKLNIQIPSNSSVEDIGHTLSNGVILCHLINQLYPHSVQLIHAPSINMPKLSIAKCRKNVENFIESCQRLGIDEIDMCCAHDIIEAKNTSKVARTVIMLANYTQYCQQQQHQKLNQYHNHTSFDSRSKQQLSAQISNSSGCMPGQQQQQQTAV